MRTITLLLTILTATVAQAAELDDLTITIPDDPEVVTKLDLLVHDIVAQIDKQVEDPICMTIEHTICRFNVGPERGYREEMESYYYIVQPSPFPVIDLPPGDYPLAKIREILDRQGIVSRYVEPYRTLHLVQKELAADEDWPLNGVLTQPGYGVVDATECREILAEYSYYLPLKEGFLGSPRAYAPGMEFDFSKAETVRSLVSAMAQAFGRLDDRGSVVYVNTWPPSFTADHSENAGNSEWVARVMMGARLLTPESDKPFTLEVISE